MVDSSVMDDHLSSSFLHGNPDDLKLEFSMERESFSEVVKNSEITSQSVISGADISCRKMDDVVMGAVSAPKLNESTDARVSQDGEQNDDGIPKSEPKDSSSSQDREPIVDDIIILYRTLVKDKALPPGYEKEFSSLGPVLLDAADRQLRKNAAIENGQAAVLLHDFHWQQKKSSETAKNAVEQFVAAARDRPRAYRTRLQKMLYSGPTPRKDAEEMERARWVEALSTLLRATETPMGKMLVEEPQTAQLLGAGRRVTTLRSRVRLARRYLAWLSINFEVPFPTKLEHMTDYFNVRASEPCTRGTLKNTHRSFSFLEEVAGMPRTECVTENPLYQVLYHELLSKAAPGRATRQAPRMPVAMLRSIEQLVVNENVDTAAELGNVAFR